MPIFPAFVAVEVHAFGVLGRPGAADVGMDMVRTTAPDVVISSMYTGFVIPLLLNTLPVSSPNRTTAMLPPVNGTGAAVAAGVPDGVPPGV